MQAPPARAHSDFTPIPPSLVRDIPDDAGLGRPLREVLEGGSNQTWIAAWDEIGQDGLVLLAARSINDGASWSAPVRVDSPLGGAQISHIDIDIATDDLGNWVIAWSGENHEAIHLARSNDDGATWSAPVALPTSSWGVTPIDRVAPVVGASGSGTWVVGWWEISERLLEGSRIVFTRSTTGMLGPWSAPVPMNVGTDHTVAPGEAQVEPLNFPYEIATDGAGTWVVLFESGSDHYLWYTGGTFRAFDFSYVHSTDDGATWSAPAFFDADPGGDNWNGHIDMGGPADFADVAADASGNFVAVWTETNATESLGYRGRVSTSPDGVNWSAPVTILQAPPDEEFRPWRLGHVASGGPGAFTAFADSIDDGHRTGIFLRSNDAGSTWSPHGFVEPTHHLPSSPESPPVAAASNASGSIGVLWRARSASSETWWDETALFFSIDSGECGDGTVNPGEECDDADRDEGDGCDDACEIETCWTCTGSPSGCVPFADGTACVDAEPCTIAQTCTGGTCGGGGTLADGTPCSDGLGCNGSETCEAGECVRGPAILCGSCRICDEVNVACIPGSQPGCHHPLPGLDLKFTLIQHPFDPLRRRFRFRWTGSATTLAQFGDPVAGDSFELCFGPKDGAGVDTDCSLLAGAADCGGKPCWRAKPDGFAYRAKSTLRQDGFVKKLVLKEGADGQARIKVVGGGPRLDLPGLDVVPSPIYVGLRSTTGAVWEVTFVEANVRKRTSKTLSIKGGS